MLILTGVLTTEMSSDAASMHDLSERSGAHLVAGPVYPTGAGSFLQGCSKRLFDKAAGSGTTEAYPSHPPNPELSEHLFSRVRYVAGRHATENEVRDLFQQPC
jgi:hypothetical protein